MVKQIDVNVMQMEVAHKDLLFLQVEPDPNSSELQWSTYQYIGGETDFAGKYFLYKKEGKELSFRHVDQLDAYRHEWSHVKDQTLRRSRRLSEANPPPDASLDDEISFRPNELDQLEDQALLEATLNETSLHQEAADAEPTSVNAESQGEPPAQRGEPPAQRVDRDEPVRPRVSFGLPFEDISRSDGQASLPSLNGNIPVRTEVVDLTSDAARTTSTPGLFSRLVESGALAQSQAVLQNRQNEDRILKRANDELQGQYHLIQMKNEELQRRIDLLLRETDLLRAQVANNTPAQTPVTRGGNSQAQSQAPGISSTPLESQQRVTTPRNQGTAPRISGSGSSEEDLGQMRISREVRRKLKTKRPQSHSPPKRTRSRFSSNPREHPDPFYSLFPLPNFDQQSTQNQNLPSTSRAPQTYSPPRK